MRQPEFVFRGHQAAVNSVCFFADDRYLVSGDQDGLVIVWNMALKRPLVKIANAHSAAVLAVSGVGTDTVVTQGRDNKLCIWKLTAGEFTATAECVDTQPVESMNFCRVSCTRSCTADTWVAGLEADAVGQAFVYNAERRLKHTFSIERKSATRTGAREDPPMCLRLVSVSDSELLLYVGYESTALQCFRLSTPLDRLEVVPLASVSTPHKEPVMGIDASEQLVYTCAADNQVCCFELSVSGLCPSATVPAAQLPNPGGSEIRCFPSLSLVAVAGWDYAAHLYTSSLEHVTTVRFHRAALTSLDMSSQSSVRLPGDADEVVQQRWMSRPRWLAVGSRDSRISLWDVDSLITT
ncbi:Astra associated protein 1 Asa1 [Coemansia sp. RSA 552]|nr:Astra associated protein 1 Asa1 [Coemansia sp. RSA 552]